MFTSFCFTNIAFAVDAPLKQVSVRQRPPFGHGFSVDYSLDGVRHARNRENIRTNKQVMRPIFCSNCMFVSGFGNASSCNYCISANMYNQSIVIKQISILIKILFFILRI